MLARKDVSTWKNHRTRARRRGGGAITSTLKLGAVFLILITVNIYVLFLRGETSLPAVLKRGAIAPVSVKQTTTSQQAAISVAPSAHEEGRVIEGTIALGEKFRSVLSRHEVPNIEAESFFTALSKEVDFRNLRAGVSYRLELDPQNVVIVAELRFSPIETLWARHNGQGYTLERHRQELKTEVETFGGVIERSLYDSIDGLGEDTALISPFVDVFAWDLDFYTDQHPGDRFKLTVEKRYLEGEFYQYGRILAAEYTGKAGTFRALWFQDQSGRGGYYDDQGVSLERSLLKTPLQYVRISSRFGQRYHPILHRWKGHQGTDFAAPEGTPVRAAAAARVSFADRQGGSGNMVVLSHPNGVTTLYMHLSRFAKGLHSGQRVESRQVIGYVGMTGLATGPHLHFAVKQNGRYVDPMRLRATRGHALSGAALEQFKSKTSESTQTIAALEVTSPIRQAARGLAATR